MDLNAMRYRVPRQCKCGCKELEYKGLGEYVCKECGTSAYNEYGLVRNYIEKHHGASAPIISKETGVSITTIRRMIEEEKFDFLNRNDNKLR